MPYETDPNGPAGQRKYGKSFTDATSPKTDGGGNPNWMGGPINSTGAPLGAGPAPTPPNWMGDPVNAGGSLGGGLTSLAGGSGGLPQSWANTYNAQSPSTQTAMRNRWSGPGWDQTSIEKDWTGNIAPQYATGTSAMDILGGAPTLSKPSDTPAMTAGPSHAGAKQRMRIAAPRGIAAQEYGAEAPVAPAGPAAPPAPPPPGPGIVGDPNLGPPAGGGGGLTSLARQPTQHWRDLVAQKGPAAMQQYKALISGAAGQPDALRPGQTLPSWRDWKQQMGAFG